MDDGRRTNRDDQEGRDSNRLCTFPDGLPSHPSLGVAALGSSTANPGSSRVAELPESALATQEALARLDLSRTEAQGMSPSPSPSYDREKGSGANPSVTSLSEGEDEQAIYSQDQASKRKAPMTVTQSTQSTHRHLVRETYTDSALEEEEEEETPIPSPDPEDTLRPSSTFSSGMIDPEPAMGGVSKTVLEKAWGPAPVKRRTTSWLGSSGVAGSEGEMTPGDERVDRLGMGGGGLGSVGVNEVQVEQMEEAEEEPRSLADDLPPEIILQILGHLTESSDIHNALFISRIWCQCTIPLIWTRPNIQDERSLRGLIRIIRLSTGRGRDFLHRTTQTTFPYHLLIKRLYFCSLGARLQDEHVMEFQGCMALEKLTMKGNKYVSPRALTALVKGKDKLVVIEMGETRVDDHTLETLGQECPELVGLSLPDCHHFTPLGLVAFARSGTKKIRRLKLSRSIGVTSEGISAVVKVCPALLEIELAGSPDVTDTALIGIWLHAGRLREIDLKGSEKVTVKGFPVLSQLQLVGDHSEAPRPDEFVQVSSRQPDSKTVPPEGDYSVFSTIPRSVPVTLNLGTLRTVDLEGCTGLTDAAIDALTWNARWIRAITLAKCSQLTDAALVSLCRLGKHLHHVHLGHVSQLTDWGVCRLARGCNRLRYIDLAGDALLTDLSVFELATNCPKLKRVGLVKVHQLTDAAISALVDRGEDAAANLERLHLSYCDNISVKAITHLLKGAKNVTHLSLTDVTAFKQPEFQRWTQPVPASYSSGQRAAFCVFARDGVIKLRKWLIAKEGQRTSPAWRDSSHENLTTPESLREYHIRQRAAALAWLGSPATEREPRAPLAEMMASTSIALDYSMTLGPATVSLDDEQVASRHTASFHRHRQPSTLNRPTPLHARTPQGRIPSLDTSSWRSEAESGPGSQPLQPTPSNPLSTIVFPSHPPTQTAARAPDSSHTRRAGPTLGQTRSEHLDGLLEDVQRRRSSSHTEIRPAPRP